MTRILFWIGLLVLIVLAVRSKLRAMTPPDPVRRDDPRQRSAASAEPGAEIEAMACCAHCHLYFPASEAVRADGLAYCSPAHVRLPAK
jgi:uncharacterized protein